MQIHVARARTIGEIDAAFAAFVVSGPDALFDQRRPLLYQPTHPIGQLGTRVMRFPLTSATREITDVGGLMSYGANIPDAWRQIGAYTGRILKGENPPTCRSAGRRKFEFVINLTRLLRRSGSMCRPRCSRAPTR